MTDMATLRAQAAAARSADTGTSARSVPRDRPAEADVRFSTQLRAKKVMRDEMEWYEVEGYASSFERGYEMWDWYGPYTEVVSKGAADETLAADPEVVFRFNHGGTPMASTRNGRLSLWADDTGLGQRAWLNPKRADVQLLVQAIEDSDVREQSFMFRIVEGVWSPDYTEYRINRVDLDRGDVGPVTYGANPHTTVSARAGEFLHSIEDMSPLVAREAYTRLGARPDLRSLQQPAPAPALAPAARAEGRSIAMVRARLLAQLGDE
ncbi:HK97 family phage prohead protease [Streptomyces sp. NRRL S-241]|uniref:HK97 family phage prohead protease n=1 Tax=Streptomyces sp. NRRL S-241 TaxID=1463896 RepID=UPI00068A701F|nr:HK97 family phage prohead protease [Streptomyces sp. NRRL S-241]